MTNPSENLEITRLTPENLNDVCTFAQDMNLVREPEYFEINLDLQEQEKRDVFLGLIESKVVAYGILNWDPKYALFRKLGIPETQDLNVHIEHRRQGIAKTMIDYFENRARERGCEQMGIGFGIDSSYGAAQRLYTRLGYIPDGFGITHDREGVSLGEMKLVDDLCLMLVKDLVNK